MVLVDIQPKEIEAFDIMLKNTTYTGKDWAMIGYLIGNLRMKIQQGVQKENKLLQKKAAKEILGNEKKSKNKNPKA